MRTKTAKKRSPKDVKKMPTPRYSMGVYSHMIQSSGIEEFLRKKYQQGYFLLSELPLRMDRFITGVYGEHGFDVSGFKASFTKKP